MDIYAKKGHKIIVTEKSIENGYDSVKEHAKKHLEIGEMYTVHCTSVQGWSTTVYLEEFPDEEFNSVNFEDADEAIEASQSKVEKMQPLVNKRQNFISVDSETVRNSYGDFFAVGELVEHEDESMGRAIIISFDAALDENEITVHTDKGFAHLDFIAKII